MRLQKAEWIENYIKAREKTMMKGNIIVKWRDAGLWPIDCDRILEQIQNNDIIPSSQSQSISQTSIFLMSSSSDALILHSTNVSLNVKIATTNASRLEGEEFYRATWPQPAFHWGINFEWCNVLMYGIVLQKDWWKLQKMTEHYRKWWKVLRRICISNHGNTIFLVTSINRLLSLRERERVLDRE